jgi:heme exporter protein CcmD
MNSAHFGFIFAAYAVTAAIVVGMIGAVIMDHRALQRALARLAMQTQTTQDDDK